jgi:hypothetical protein
MEPFIFAAIIWVHFLADFIFQSDAMALNKSKSNYWLTVHVFVYTVIFIPFGPLFAIVNGLLHWATDWGSSRLTAYYHSKGMRREFFLVIGLDQAMHLSALILTYDLLVK